MPTAFAQDATWLANPGSGNFNSAANWTPATVPTGFAAFGNSSITTLTFSGSRNLDGFVFDAGAPAYTFNLTGGFGVVFHTDGIVNNSANAPTFNVSNSPLRFDDTSSAGNAIINLNAGTVQFLGNSTAGLARLNAAGSISGAGTFDLGASHRLVVGGNNLSTNLTGSIVSGAIDKVGTGTLTLSGANSYSNGTTISNGTLAANHATGGNIDTFGSGTVDLKGGGLRSDVTANLQNGISFADNTTSVLSAASGQTLTLPNSVGLGVNAVAQFGTTTDTGTILYGAFTSADPSSSVVVAGGRLKDLNDNLVGLTFQASTTVNAGAVLDFNDSSNQAIRNLRGDGSVVTGTVGGTFLTLYVDPNSSATFGGVISGPGTVMVDTSNAGADGKMILTGANDYIGGTIICACSTLQLGNGGTTGSIVGDVANDGVLAFKRSDSASAPYVFAGVISGGGEVKQIGSGTVVLSGANTYFGGTVISSGTVRVTNSDPGNSSSVGIGTVTLDGGTFQAGANNLDFSNAFAVTETGGTVDTNGNTLTISGTIENGSAAPGVLTKSGAGMLILKASNTYSGGTVISADTLQSNNNNAVGSGVVTLDGGTFRSGAANLNFANDFLINATGGTIDNGHRRLTLSGVISDGIGAPAQLTLIGGPNGTTILSGVNTYSGGTLVSRTTVQVRNNSAVGTGTVTLNQGQFQAGAANLNISNSFAINDTPAGSAIDNNNRVLTLSGNITDGNGPGMLTFGNSGAGGRTILTGTNTYTGGTDICNCATVQLGDATHTASIVGTVRNDGEFRILNADTTGITRIVNLGLTEFFNTTSASTATIVNRALLGFADHSTAGNATVRNVGGGMLFSNHSTAGGAIVTNLAGGLIAFANHSTAGDAVITNRAGGLISFANNSTAGDATITTRQFAQTFFDDHSNGGNARFITDGTGFVDFSGTSGAGGLHRITAGSIEGSGTYFIGADNTLITGGNNRSSEVSGVIADFDPCGCGPAGSGSLEKVGTGNLILSGTSTYTGATTVNGGILSVNGDITLSSGVTVNAGGTLGGNGIVGDTTINGGTLAPGNSIGLLTVQGSLVFTAAASYLVEVSPTNADRTNVMGAATLGGATVNAHFVAGSYIARQYTILNATGGLGGTTFNALVNTDLPANFVSSLSYDGDNAYLNLTLSFIPPPNSGLNVNQQNVGNAIVGFFNRTGGIPLVFGGLTPTGLSQVSGETATGSQQATFDAMNLFLGLLTDPFVAGRGDGGAAGAGPAAFAGEDDGASAYAAKKPSAARDAFAKFPTKADVARRDLLFGQRWSVWGAAYGGGSTTDGNAALGSNTATARAFGVVAGADYRISPYTLAGFALAGGGTSFGVNGFGSGRSDLFQAGAFIRHTVGPAYVTAALAYGWQDVTTDRTVTVAGIDRLRAEFNANAWSGRVEGGYRFVTSWMGLTPYAAGQFTTYQLPAYAEQVLSGANTFALNYAAKDVTASRSELGMRTDRSFAMQNAILTLRGRAAWAHNFNIDRNITPVFQTLPGASFVVNGAGQAHDAALVTGSAEMKWLNGFSLAATFEGEFSSVTKSYAGKGVARYAW
jgi:autotransporter-associated beta strand protein